MPWTRKAGTPARVALCGAAMLLAVPVVAIPDYRAQNEHLSDAIEELSRTRTAEAPPETTATPVPPERERAALAEQLLPGDSVEAEGIRNTMLRLMAYLSERAANPEAPPTGLTLDDMAALIGAMNSAELPEAGPLRDSFTSLLAAAKAVSRELLTTERPPLPRIVDVPSFPTFENPRTSPPRPTPEVSDTTATPPAGSLWDWVQAGIATLTPDSSTTNAWSEWWNGLFSGSGEHASNPDRPGPVPQASPPPVDPATGETVIDSVTTFGIAVGTPLYNGVTNIANSLVNTFGGSKPPGETAEPPLLEGKVPPRSNDPSSTEFIGPPAPQRTNAVAQNTPVPEVARNPAQEPGNEVGKGSETLPMPSSGTSHAGGGAGTTGGAKAAPVVVNPNVTSTGHLGDAVVQEPVPPTKTPVGGITVAKGGAASAAPLVDSVGADMEDSLSPSFIGPTQANPLQTGVTRRPLDPIRQPVAVAPPAAPLPPVLAPQTPTITIVLPTASVAGVLQPPPAASATSDLFKLPASTTPLASEDKQPAVRMNGMTLPPSARSDMPMPPSPIQAGFLTQGSTPPVSSGSLGGSPSPAPVFVASAPPERRTDTRNGQSISLTSQTPSVPAAQSELVEAVRAIFGGSSLTLAAAGSGKSPLLNDSDFIAVRRTEKFPGASMPTKGQPVTSPLTSSEVVGPISSTYRPPAHLVARKVDKKGKATPAALGKKPASALRVDRKVSAPHASLSRRP